MLRTLYAIEESFLEVFESDLLDEDIEAYQDTLEALTGEADKKRAGKRRRIHQRRDVATVVGRLKKTITYRIWQRAVSIPEGSSYI